VIPPDTRPPVIDEPWRWEIAETTGIGTIVNFTRTATDDRDPNPVVACDPPSGSYFELGLNYTYCTATDNAGNSSDPVQITILVIGPDTTPPDIFNAPDISVPATDPSGAMVDLWVMASDDRGGEPSLSCTSGVGNIAPKGSNLFPINPTGVSTEVACTAADAAGNTANKTFTVHVQGAGEQVEGLIVTLNSWSLKALGMSLRDKLTTVKRMLAMSKTRQACENIVVFLSQVDTQDGKGLQGWQAWELRTTAQRIQAVIGC
jgi:hypothetical protein